MSEAAVIKVTGVTRLIHQMSGQTGKTVLARQQTFRYAPPSGQTGKHTFVTGYTK